MGLTSLEFSNQYTNRRPERMKILQIRGAFDAGKNGKSRTYEFIGRILATYFQTRNVFCWNIVTDIGVMF